MDRAERAASHHWIYKWRNPAIVGALLALGAILFVLLDIASLIIPHGIQSPGSGRLVIVEAPHSIRNATPESDPLGFKDEEIMVAEESRVTEREQTAPADVARNVTEFPANISNLAPAPSADMDQSQAASDDRGSDTSPALSSPEEAPASPPPPTSHITSDRQHAAVITTADVIPTDDVIATADVSSRAHALLRPDCRTPLKVFMYDLPRKFNFGVLAAGDGERDAVWDGPIPALHGGNKIQYAAAYFLTLDLLQSQKNSCEGSQAVRVTSPQDADVFFVPFFSSLSAMMTHAQRGFESKHYDQLQAELAQFLNTSSWWHLSGGRDHIIPSLNPNALTAVRAEVAAAMLIVVDLDRYSPATARLSKDIIAPYVHLLPLLEEPLPPPPGRASEVFQQRTTLLFFQGTVQKGKKSGEVRRRVSDILSGEADVHSVAKKASDKHKEEASEGMARSKFCLHIRGDTGSSCRLFDAIARLCVPVIVSDFTDLPFEDELRYTDFALFFPEEKAMQAGELAKFVRGVGQQQWEALWTNLTTVRHHFEYEAPASEGSAVDMIWEQVVHKLPSVRLAISRSERLVVPEWWKLTGEDEGKEPRSSVERGA